MSLREFLYRVLGYEMDVRLPMSRAERARTHEILFRELAFAVRHNCPLELALKSTSEHKTLRFGHDYLLLGGLILALLFVGGFALIGWPVLVLAIVAVLVVLAEMVSAQPRGRHVSDVAAWLGRWIAEGRTLSEAMFCMPHIFTQQQAKAVAVGEETGRLAEALDALADYCAVSDRMARIGGVLVYPLTVLIVGLTIMGFIEIKIIPKYADIFSQLGADFPRFSQQVLFGFGNVLYFGNPMVWLGLAMAVLILTGLLNYLFGRVSILPVLALVLAVLLVTWLGMPLARGPATSGVIAGLARVLVLVGAFFAIIIWHMRREQEPILPISFHTAMAGLLGRVVPIWKVRLSRFLFNLGLSLRSRIPVPDALQSAGETAGGLLRHDATRLRALVEQGHSLSDTLKSSPWFRGHVGAVLSLAEWNGSLAEDCLRLAEELNAESAGQLVRLGACCEYVANVLLGIVFGLFVVACYLPLLSIPNAVR